MVSMFSHWTEAFHCRQATPSSVAKALLENSTPIWKMPFGPHIDQQTHITGQVTLRSHHCLVLQYFHCVYHPQSSGLVKCPNSIKTGKICRGSPNTLTKSIAIGPSKS